MKKYLIKNTYTGKLYYTVGLKHTRELLEKFLEIDKFFLDQSEIWTVKDNIFRFYMKSNKFMQYSQYQF